MFHATEETYRSREACFHPTEGTFCIREVPLRLAEVVFCRPEALRDDGQVNRGRREAGLDDRQAARADRPVRGSNNPPSANPSLHVPARDLSTASILICGTFRVRKSVPATRPSRDRQQDVLVRKLADDFSAVDVEIGEDEVLRAVRPDEDRASRSSKPDDFVRLC
jgi:hypothetical protein